MGEDFLDNFSDGEIVALALGQGWQPWEIYGPRQPKIEFTEHFKRVAKLIDEAFAEGMEDQH